MVEASKKIDGIGLARPLCQEPQLCRSVLEGKVRGAILQRPDETNYGLTNIVAGSQIGRMATGKKPIDMSDEKNEGLFLQAMERWTKTKAEDIEMQTFGYVDLSSIYRFR